MRNGLRFFVLILLLPAFVGCEYVRPTLNAPLEQWKPGGGYRFSNLAPPEADNTDGLFLVTSFSGGGTRASTLAYRRVAGVGGPADHLGTASASGCSMNSM